MKHYYLKHLKIALLSVLLLAGSGFNSVQTDRIFVSFVTDGDTVNATIDGNNESIRLFGIDAPEKSQAFGQVAKQFTTEMINHKVVTIKTQPSEDRYKRTVADIYVNDTIWLNYELVKAGLAWHWSKYSKNPKLAEAMEYAKKNKKGLWKDLDTAKPPVAPWEYRKQTKGN